MPYNLKGEWVNDLAAAQEIDGLATDSYPIIIADPEGPYGDRLQTMEGYVVHIGRFGMASDGEMLPTSNYTITGWLYSAYRGWTESEDLDSRITVHIYANVDQVRLNALPSTDTTWGRFAFYEHENGWYDVYQYIVYIDLHQYSAKTFLAQVLYNNKVQNIILRRDFQI